MIILFGRATVFTGQCWIAPEECAAQN